jgi:hypothetical protein
MNETRLHLTYYGPRLKTQMENNQVIGLAVTWSQLSNEVGTRAAINLASPPAVRQNFTAYRSRRPSSLHRALGHLKNLNTILV